MDTPFKDPSMRYARHTHHHLHDDYDDVSMGFTKRSKLLTDKVNRL
jgi:hypothetical protein